MSPELKFTIDLAKRAGAVALRGIDKINSIKKNDARDVSTDVDIQVERLIVSSLQKKFPKYNIIREEEEDINNGSDFTWAIDPIDGTKYFVKGIKLFNISIGLLYKNKPFLGVIYNPGFGDCYWAEKNKGAFLNNKKLAVSKINKLSAAIVALDMFRSDQLPKKQQRIFIKRLVKIISNVYRVRSFGCGSLSLVYLAQGYFDAYVDLTGQEEIKDLAAGLIIAKEAGAKLSNLNGGSVGLDVNSILVTNKIIHKKIIDLLK